MVTLSLIVSSIPEDRMQYKQRLENRHNLLKKRWVHCNVLEESEQEHKVGRSATEPN